MTLGPTIRGRRRPDRVVGFGALALVMLLAAVVPAAPADARRPWTPAQPSGAYTPRHVHQTRDNCVFASGQMLLDKWTHGRVRATQARLRKASRDDEGGAGFRDLARGFANSTGVRLRWSPAGGDPMTWWQLLERLERDGGAVLFGEYGKLPAEYTRWNPRFARSAKDDHAVYVERYDRANGRVWMMDPLAPGGTWIDVRTLRRFARFDGDLVYAAATPLSRRWATAPLTDHAYRLGMPAFGQAVVAGSLTPVSVPLTIVDGFPLPTLHHAVGRWERLDDAVGEIGRDDEVILPSTDEATTGAVALSAVRPPEVVTTISADARPSASGFAFALPVPERAGRYRLTVSLVPAGGTPDQPARILPPVDARVDPPYAGRLAVVARPASRVGGSLSVAIDVANVGSVDWRAAPVDDTKPGSRIDAQPGRPAVLTIAWRSPAGDVTAAGAVDLPLAPGATTLLRLELAAPPTAGSWTLELDVVHPAAGSLAAAGMAAPPLTVAVDPPVSEAGA